MELWVKILLQLGVGAIGTYLWLFCIAMERKIAKTEKVKKRLEYLAWVGPILIVTSIIIDPIFNIYSYAYTAGISVFGGLFYSFMLIGASTLGDDYIQKLRGMTLFCLIAFGAPFLIFKILLLFMEPNYWINSYNWICVSFLLFVPWLFRGMRHLHRSSRIDSKFFYGEITKKERKELHNKLNKEEKINNKIKQRELRLNTVLKKNYFRNKYRNTKIKWMKIKEKYLV